MNTIVCGVDGSETALVAAHRAAGLARVTGAELRLVCAFEGYEIERIKQGSEELVLSTEEDASRTARDVALRVQAEFQDVVLRSCAVEGKPGPALVRAAEEQDADLIVVGNKRVQGLARVLGSVAREVAAHAGCDVYVAHTHKR